MSEGRLNADIDGYLGAWGANAPPPPIASDPLVAGLSPTEQLLYVLGLAANAGDGTDNTEIVDGYSERDAMAAEAAGKFEAQDARAGADLNGLAQQIPQVASGIVGALAGALGGSLAAVAQLPQQVAQGAAQAMQSGLTLAQPSSGGGSLDDPFIDDLDNVDDGAVPGGAPFDGGGSGLGSAGTAIPGVTAPAAQLGPPPVPSAGTSPAAAPALSPRPASPVPAAHPGTGISGVPMLPPAGMAGTSAQQRDDKVDTRRVSVPPIRHGAPVQGRLATPPAAPAVTKKRAGTPVAARRIIAPPGAHDDVDTPDTR